MAESDPEYDLNLQLSDSVLFCRVIRKIYTTNDPRVGSEKPHANEIILGFWWLHLGRSIRSLRTLLFCDVEERTLTHMKTGVYDAMGISYIEKLRISPRQRGSTERRQFDKLSQRAPFGKIARRIERNEDMRTAGIEVIRFTFLPQVDVRDPGDQGDNFHFKITFGRL